MAAGEIRWVTFCSVPWLPRKSAGGLHWLDQWMRKQVLGKSHLPQVPKLNFHSWDPSNYRFPASQSSPCSQVMWVIRSLQGCWT